MSTLFWVPYIRVGQSLNIASEQYQRLTYSFLPFKATCPTGWTLNPAGDLCVKALDSPLSRGNQSAVCIKDGMGLFEYKTMDTSWFINGRSISICFFFFSSISIKARYHKKIVNCLQKFECSVSLEFHSLFICV